ncbi:hypothetical protein L6164_033254 [Bauhinia variegata]|uniref:Uncharacterized protein n=1 Tax=Bauhinia variegata TaxID=167791 RepID=A0ACB9KR82_BAUVA|nr:hypothetical protein L6164_033254 [Bauhinia variegata]
MLLLHPCSASCTLTTWTLRIRRLLEPLLPLSVILFLIALFFYFSFSLYLHFQRPPTIQGLAWPAFIDQLSREGVLM